jgi:hypothetical protein
MSASESLEDDALGLIVVERQALEFLEYALVKLESSDSLKLSHGSGLQTLALLA